MLVDRERLKPIKGLIVIYLVGIGCQRTRQMDADMTTLYRFAVRIEAKIRLLLRVAAVPDFAKAVEVKANSPHLPGEVSSCD